MKLTARDIARFTHGKLVSGSANSIVEAVSIDTRTIERGDLFVAIRGPRRDGHDYLANALERAAAGIVVLQPIEIAGSAFQVQVKNTTRSTSRSRARRARARSASCRRDHRKHGQDDDERSRRSRHG